MARQGTTKAITKKISFGEESLWDNGDGYKSFFSICLYLLLFSSGRMEHEPIDESKPNVPQVPRQVGTSVPNAHNQVAATMSPRYLY